MPKVPEAYLEARRGEILEAARRAFTRKGTQTTTMVEIAEEAGLTPGAIYRYFPNKERLIAACFDANAEDVIGHWQNISPDSDPVASTLDFARKAVEWLDTPAARTDTILHLEYVLELARTNDTAGLAALKAENDRIVGDVEERVRAAQAAGGLPHTIDARRYAGALFSFYWGLRLRRVIDPTVETQGQLEQLLLLFLKERAAGGEGIGVSR